MTTITSEQDLIGIFGLLMMSIMIGQMIGQRVKESIMSSSQKQKYVWHLASANNWATYTSHRGYTGAIAYVSGTGYTLTITGSGAPAAAPYNTLKLAKSAFRYFLHTK